MGYLYRSRGADYGALHPLVNALTTFPLNTIHDAASVIFVFCVLLLAHTSCQYLDRVDSAAPAGANRGAVLYSLCTLLYYNARDCNSGRHFFMNK